MLKRTLTTLVLMPPVVYLIAWSPEWLFLLALMAAVILALHEYFGLCGAMGLKVFPWIGYGAAVAVCLVQVLRGDLYHVAVTPWLVAIVLLFATWALRRSTDLKDYLVAVSTTIFGILYIGLTLSCLVPICFSLNEARSEWIFGGEFGARRGLGSPGSRSALLLFLVIWAGDITAYLVGRPAGRIPFFSRISPRKTWEGAVAGLAASVVAAWACAHWFFAPASSKTVILLAVWIALAGQAGDLVESAIKRGANQKDSGTILPGHGGFLDRIDSLLFGAPALWLALVVLGCFT
jgi:phosphatidate cytidylyltransferase